MSIPHFTDRNQYCEHCDGIIIIGDDDVEVSQDGYFCSEECAKDHLYYGSDFKKVYLTNDIMFRSVD